jgi:hypothetical protein
MSKTDLRSVLALTRMAALSGCNEKASLEPAQQSGNAPPLPKAHNFLLPPMQVPVGVGWAQGQSPKVAPGLKIEKIASALMHPRHLSELANDPSAMHYEVADSAAPFARVCMISWRLSFPRIGSAIGPILGIGPLERPTREQTAVIARGTSVSALQTLKRHSCESITARGHQTTSMNMQAIPRLASSGVSADPSPT